jgi:stage II sporulation protein D
VNAKRSSRPVIDPEGPVDGPGSRDPVSRDTMVRAAVIVGAFIFLMAIFSCRGVERAEDRPLAAFPARVEKAPEVRIVLAERSSAVEMALEGPFRIMDDAGREVFNRNSRLGRLHVSFDGTQIRLGALPMVVRDRPDARGEPMAVIRIVPGEVGSLSINGKVYPGDVEFIGIPGTKTLHCVLHLNIEMYVCGVLGGEVPVDKWHDEALRAHAVVSRTYAMFYHLLNAGKPWDFGATGREAQEFSPGVPRNARVNRAVNGTRGQVLAWNNQVFPAFFHSSCGGHTLDSSHVFTKTSIKPLSGRECTWCLKPELGNKLASWEKRMTMATIASRLAAGGQKNPELARQLRGKGDIYSLEAAERSPDGRVVSFKVRFPYAPGSAVLWANDVRLALGARELPSTKCEMDVSRSAVAFKGSGWGHGVGLCQFGSLGMAMAGNGYQDILAYYYPHSQIVRMGYEETGPGGAEETSGPAGNGVKAPPAPTGRPPVRTKTDADRAGGDAAKG